jgi:TonB family protein
MHLRLLAALLVSGLVACAPTPAPAPPVSARPPAVEDALPGIVGEDEVDVPARPVAAIEPVYPPQLRAIGVEGDVEARVAVMADGSVGAARLVASSHPAFTEATREALRTARFHPALRSGRVVPSWVGLRLYFRLDD